MAFITATPVKRKQSKRVISLLSLKLSDLYLLLLVIISLSVLSSLNFPDPSSYFCKAMTHASFFLNSEGYIPIFSSYLCGKCLNYKPSNLINFVILLLISSAFVFILTPPPPLSSLTFTLIFPHLSHSSPSLHFPFTHLPSFPSLPFLPSSPPIPLLSPPP